MLSTAKLQSPNIAFFKEETISKKSLSFICVMSTVHKATIVQLRTAVLKSPSSQMAADCEKKARA